MSSPHVFNILKSGFIESTPGGRRISANITNFSALRGMALYYLILEPGGIREPHWHPNANELTYCVKGSAIVTILSDSNRHDTFDVEAGDLFFVQTGYLHHIENTSAGASEFAVVFNNGLPEDFGITGAVGSQTDEILASTFNTSTESFSKINKSPNGILIGRQAASPKTDAGIPDGIPNDHKFSILKFPPQVETKGGVITLGNTSTFPILKGLACYYLKLYKNGVREPHWHPNAAELDYIIKGKARMNILSPEGKLDTFEVSEGNIVFIPPAYFHYIENIYEGETEFAVFFNNENPEDIGISASVGAYSNQMLASLFNTDIKIFNAIPKIQQSVLVVPGINR